MEKYNNIFKELHTLFPHCKDIRIEVDTNEADMATFSNEIKETSKSQFTFGTSLEPHVYSALRTPFGMIKLNKYDKTS